MSGILAFAYFLLHLSPDNATLINFWSEPFIPWPLSTPPWPGAAMTILVCSEDVPCPDLAWECVVMFGDQGQCRLKAFDSHLIENKVNFFGLQSVVTMFLGSILRPIDPHQWHPIALLLLLWMLSTIFQRQDSCPFPPPSHLLASHSCPRALCGLLCRGSD